MIEQLIKLRDTIPELGKYTISEDFSILMIKQFLEQKPQLIVEMGSGVSTLFLAYCLEEIGGGTIVSFEHLKQYANQTKQLLAQHHLDYLDIHIIEAPLIHYQFEQQLYHWYDTSQYLLSNPIDCRWPSSPKL